MMKKEENRCNLLFKKNVKKSFNVKVNGTLNDL